MAKAKVDLYALKKKTLDCVMLGQFEHIYAATNYGVAEAMKLFTGTKPEQWQKMVHLIAEEDELLAIELTRPQKNIVDMAEAIIKYSLTRYIHWVVSDEQYEEWRANATKNS